ncbi:hypothetical protein [Pseudomonas sp. S2_H10]
MRSKFDLLGVMVISFFLSFSTFVVILMGTICVVGAGGLFIVSAVVSSFWLAVARFMCLKFFFIAICSN